jgi:hypothetical protein
MPAYEQARKQFITGIVAIIMKGATPSRELIGGERDSPGLDRLLVEVNGNDHDDRAPNRRAK